MLSKGDRKGQQKMLFRAQVCITELMCSLNMEAGEGANFLYRLCDYSNRGLAQANVQAQDAPIEGLLREERGAIIEGWREELEPLLADDIKGITAIEEKPKDLLAGKEPDPLAPRGRRGKRRDRPSVKGAPQPLPPG